MNQGQPYGQQPAYGLNSNTQYVAFTENGHHGQHGAPIIAHHIDPHHGGHNFDSHHGGHHGGHHGSHHGGVLFCILFVVVFAAVLFFAAN